MWGHHVHEPSRLQRGTRRIPCNGKPTEIDGGEIIAQFKKAILPTDTADILPRERDLLEMETLSWSSEDVGFAACRHSHTPLPYAWHPKIIRTIFGVPCVL
jgi:hypothetical protein